MLIQDQNFYPRAFTRFEVTAADDNGNPTTTRFYHGNAHVFTWTQTWNEYGKCTAWTLTLID